MSTEKHSPLPWCIGPYPGHVQDGSARLVANCMGYSDSTDHSGTLAENEANAKLIVEMAEKICSLEREREEWRDNGCAFPQRCGDLGMWRASAIALSKDATRFLECAGYAEERIEAAMGESADYHMEDCDIHDLVIEKPCNCPLGKVRKCLLGETE